MAPELLPTDEQEVTSPWTKTSKRSGLSLGDDNEGDEPDHGHEPAFPHGKRATGQRATGPEVEPTVPFMNKVFLHYALLKPIKQRSSRSGLSVWSSIIPWTAPVGINFNKVFPSCRFVELIRSDFRYAE